MWPGTSQMTFRHGPKFKHECDMGHSGKFGIWQGTRSGPDAPEGYHPVSTAGSHPCDFGHRPNSATSRGPVTHDCWINLNGTVLEEIFITSDSALNEEGLKQGGSQKKCIWGRKSVLAIIIYSRLSPLLLLPNMVYFLRITYLNLENTLIKCRKYWKFIKKSTGILKYHSIVTVPKTLYIEIC